jgi:hypothetical protein
LKALPSALLNERAMFSRYSCTPSTVYCAVGKAGFSLIWNKESRLKMMNYARNMLWKSI